MDNKIIFTPIEDRRITEMSKCHIVHAQKNVTYNHFNFHEKYG
ncbi:hypothetical protein [Methanobrevibacter filiformis]|nr:hypothetical protein [Methanobrevibacter filiformis]